MSAKIFLGYEQGEVCNRDGCQGILDEYDTDTSCSCHINPPCGHCVNSRVFCPVCEWDGGEEQQEAWAAEHKEYMSDKKQTGVYMEILEKQKPYEETVLAHWFPTMYRGAPLILGKHYEEFLAIPCALFSIHTTGKEVGHG